MEDEPIIVFIDRDEEINIGEESVIASVFENHDYATIFEDDGNTGYFYAATKEMQTLDALHIYDVNAIIDKYKHSNLRILWNEDFSRSYLSINNVYHAMFDFSQKMGLCRNSFPPANENWTKIKERTLTDELLKGNVI